MSSIDFVCVRLFQTVWPHLVLTALAAKKEYTVSFSWKRSMASKIEPKCSSQGSFFKKPIKTTPILTFENCQISPKQKQPTVIYSPNQQPPRSCAMQ